MSKSNSNYCRMLLTGDELYVRCPDADPVTLDYWLDSRYPTVIVILEVRKVGEMEDHYLQRRRNQLKQVLKLEAKDADVAAVQGVSVQQYTAARRVDRQQELAAKRLARAQAEAQKLAAQQERARQEPEEQEERRRELLAEVDAKLQGTGDARRLKQALVDLQARFGRLQGENAALVEQAAKDKLPGNQSKVAGPCVKMAACSLSCRHRLGCVARRG